MDAGMLMELELSEKFRNEFELRDVLGRGGMGVVYRALQKKLNDRPVAIKFLLEDYAQQDPVALRRFIDEGKICSTLNHPNVVQLYLYGRDNLLYLVYEFVDGQSLEALLENTPRGHLSLQEGVELAIDICRGLGHAHEKGVVHRDIKPANILVEKATNTAKLTDFGIARNPFTGARTKTGIVVGTPAYMAPEQCRGEKDLDARSDVYAVCVMIYEMLSGRLPYPGQGIELVRHHADPKCKPIHLSQVQPTVPQSIASIVHRGLEKERDNRWRDGNELADALEQTLKAGLKEVNTMQKSAVGATAALDVSGKRLPRSTRGTKASKATGATVRQPSMKRSAKQKTAHQRPISSMAVSAVSTPDDKKPLGLGIVAALFLAAIAGWFLMGSGAAEIVEISLKLADRNLTVSWRTNIDTIGKLKEVKGLVGWQLKDDGGSEKGVLHTAKGTFEGVDSTTIEFVVTSDDGKSLHFIFPMIAMSLDATAMQALEKAKWSFERPVTIQVPGKLPEHFEINSQVDEVALTYTTEKGLLLPILTGTCRQKKGDKSVFIEFINFSYDCLRQPNAAIKFPIAQLSKKKLLLANSKANEFMRRFSKLKVKKSLMSLIDEKKTLLGPDKGPSLPKVKSSEWNEAVSLFEAFALRKYQESISKFLLNPCLPLAERKKMKASVYALNMLLNRMAAQCFDDKGSTFWAPGSKPWRQIHKEKPHLYGERSDTHGFWVPTVFLNEAIEPIVVVEKKAKSKPEKWAQKCERKLGTNQPSFATEADKLLPSANLDRDYYFNEGGAGFMPGHEVPFKDLTEEFIKKLRDKREIRLKEPPVKGRVALIFSTSHFDVASTLRFTVGDKELYLFANRSNDFNETQIQYKGVCSQFKEEKFDPLHQYLCEDPIHWYVEIPVVWLEGNEPLITIESFCLGLPHRIGKNSRSFGTLMPSVTNFLDFINMTVLSEIECYEVKN